MRERVGQPAGCDESVRCAYDEYPASAARRVPPFASRLDGPLADRKSKPPPCVCKERRHKDGAPSRVEMSERVGQPPILGFFFPCADTICAMNDAQPCKCGHPFASHTRDIHDTGGMKTDFPISPKSEVDIFSGGEAGKSGCTECPCRQWRPANY
jgi:hypothetical protein